MIPNETPMKLNYLILLFIVGISILKSWDSNSSKAPTASNAIIDLNLWDFGKNGNVDLNGEREYYREALLMKKNYSYNEYHYEPNTQGLVCRNLKLTIDFIW